MSTDTKATPIPDDIAEMLAQLTPEDYAQSMTKEVEEYLLNEWYEMEEERREQEYEEWLSRELEQLH